LSNFSLTLRLRGLAVAVTSYGRMISLDIKDTVLARLREDTSSIKPPHRSSLQRNSK
jgi:hypothetical protein